MIYKNVSSLMLVTSSFMCVLLAVWFMCRKDPTNDIHSHSHSHSQILDDVWPPLIWHAPFATGSGYGIEALSFVEALLSMSTPFSSAPSISISESLRFEQSTSGQHKQLLQIGIIQHGDAVNREYWQGLTVSTQRLLSLLHEKGLQLIQQYGDVKNGLHDTMHNIRLIVVCHSEPGAWSVGVDMPALYSTSRCPPFMDTGVLNIARTMFETDRLPATWSQRLNRMDAVWVPTEFARDVFIANGVNSTKVQVVAEAIDVNFFNPHRANLIPFELNQHQLMSWRADVTQYEDANAPPFRFLSIFKVEERKNWKGLLNAFLCTFARFNYSDTSIQPEMILLASAYHEQTSYQEAISLFQRQCSCCQQVEQALLPPIRLLKPHLSSSNMPSLYAFSDAFILPTRGEGFCRPCVEAMSMELPVIVTNWSGPTSFLHPAHSYPLNITAIVEIQEGPFRGHRWAQPSDSHLQLLMQDVFENRTEATERGRLARQFVIDRYSPSKIARDVMVTLSKLLS